MKSLAELIPEIALKEVGVEEVGTSNRGPRVDEYQKATWLNPADWGAWCAAFVCWVVREAMAVNGGKDKDGKPYSFKRPRTAGAWDYERWSLEQDESTQTLKRTSTRPIREGDLKKGDLVIFTFSHIGIAVADAQDGKVMTVEGNSNAAGSRTGGKVCVQHRDLSLIRSRIRFTV